MLSLTHTFISLPLPLYFHHSVAIFASAFLLHLFADSFLHWNIYPHLFKRFPWDIIALDVVAGVLLAWLVTGEEFFTMRVLAAVSGGNMPDILQMGWELKQKYGWGNALSWAKPFFVWHDKLQSETESVTRGLISQVIAISLALILLIV